MQICQLAGIVDERFPAPPKASRRPSVPPLRRPAISKA
jgi:hypothetical protein